MPLKGTERPKKTTKKQRFLYLCTGFLVCLFPVISHAQFNVVTFGASPNDYGNDTNAIQSAIDAAISNGGGEVFFPPGDYVVGGTGLDLDAGNNIKIVGSGTGTTAIHVAPGTNWHVFSFVNARHVGIRDMTINGNRINQNAGHCIRGENLNGFHIENVHLEDCYSYGIGLQAGTFKRIFINNVVIVGSGQDGIDIKNKNSNNEQLFISNLVIESPGRNEVGQSGLCLRGPTQLTDIVINFDEKTMQDAVGIRFRGGEVGSIHGVGAHYSSLSNFRINGNESSTGAIVNAREVQITNGYISRGNIGVAVFQNDASITNVSTRNVDGAAFILNDGANYTKVVNSRAVACGSGLEIESEYNNISNNEFRGNTRYGIEIERSARENRIFHNNVTANRTNLSDQGSATILEGNLGIGTR